MQEKAERFIRNFGAEAAGRAFEEALESCVLVDGTGEAHWVALAVEIMRIQRLRQNVVTDIALSVESVIGVTLRAF
jgi:hypothetical protein